MPLYQYDCPVCHAVRQEARPMAERDYPTHCDCGAPMPRVSKRQKPMQNRAVSSSPRPHPHG